MSLHIEMAAAKDVTLSAALAGVTIGDDVCEQPSITINYDEAFVLVGSSAELTRLGERIIHQASLIAEKGQ